MKTKSAHLFFFSIFNILLFNSCNKKEIHSVAYKRTGEIIKPVSSVKCDKSYGKWTLKNINVSTHGITKSIELNQAVYISNDNITDENNKIVASKYNDMNGIYTFKNLDSLNGFFYLKDAFQNEYLTFDSGLTVKIKNGNTDKFTSTISLFLER